MPSSLVAEAPAGPAKHPDLLVRQNEPFNGGPPPDLLVSDAVTPTELFFVRNHGPIPDVAPAAFRLHIGGLVYRTVSLSLDDLRLLFPKRTVAATLQCAGNRRRELLDVGDIPGEVPWDLEAISHGEWAGVSLRGVLEWVGVRQSATHVAFTGLDEVTRRGATFGFGASIPLAKALAAEVLLAYEMNGQPLTPAHGAPLRLIVPGYIGARSVKWLGQITVQDEPSDNYFQRVAYRLFPSDADPATARDSDGRMLDELFTTAAICAPLVNETVAAGPLTVRGYALGQGGAPLSRVELSADGGQTWQPVTLLGRRAAWTWTLWEATVSLPPGTHELVARAVDVRGRVQPPDVRDTWNFKGYMNNAYHRVVVHVL